MLLCDHAEIADNKLFINGAGWELCSTPTPPHAVAVLVAVPWGQTNQPHPYRLQLVDEDDAPVVQPGPTGQVTIEASGSFEVGRPPGVPHGIEIGVPLVLNVGPLGLEPGKGYHWQLSIDNHADDAWRLTFRTLRQGAAAPIS
jgi:Family of unknown function (DUF6941)